MKRFVVFALAPLILSACGREPVDEPATRSSAALGDAIVVMERTLLDVVPVEGTVAPRQRAEISTRIMARITEVPVDLGSAVQRGDVLIRLGSADVEVGRARAEAQVTLATQAQADAARQAARMDTLYAQDVIPLVQRDQTRLAKVKAESDLAMAEASLREVSAMSAYSRITAPFGGRIVQRNVDPGDLAAPGQPLLVIESDGARDAVLAVPADLALALAVGDSLTISGRDGRTVSGPIRALASGADPRSRTTEVRVALPADWPTGVSVRGLIPSGEIRAVTIPTAAIERRGQLTGVRVVDEGGATLRWIRLGRSYGEETVVLSGLLPGERVLP